MTGNVVWPDEVANAEKYPFTDEAAHRFFSQFGKGTFTFDSDIGSIYLHFAKENLPRHSYADGHLYAQTINELNEAGWEPKPVGFVRLECGGPLSAALIKPKRECG